MSKKFKARLFRPSGVGTWTFASIPKAVSTSEGYHARMRVKGTIDGVPYRSSLMPAGGGEVFVVVNSSVRSRIGKQAGDAVVLQLEPDHRPVALKLPGPFKKALDSDLKARDRFGTLAPSHRKAFVDWIAKAKQLSTQERRVGRALEMLRRGQHLN